MYLANWLLHITGGDNGSGAFYLEISGFISLLGWTGALITYLRRHNCHVHHCWRLAKHPVAGTAYVTCKKHHPGIQYENVEAKHIRQAHIKAKKG